MSQFFVWIWPWVGWAVALMSLIILGICRCLLKEKQRELDRLQRAVNDGYATISRTEIDRRFKKIK